jgi:uncharacterized protein YybS (DUF2232 family)
VFAGLAAAAALGTGSVQYLAVNCTLIAAGMLAVQGVAVAHVWLASRQLQIVGALVYVMLLIQPAMVLPFVVIGLLDIWFDYRRVDSPENGG